jgi:hypothetical protein
MPRLVSLSVILATALTAQAGAIVDQEQANRNAGQNVFDTNVLAQTFTVGFTGQLKVIEIWLWHEPSAPSEVSLTLELRDTADGKPGTTLLGTATILGVAVPENGAYIWVEFPAPIPVVKDQVLAYVLKSSQAWGMGTLYGTSAFYPDPYTGGGAFDSQDGMVWNPSLAAGDPQDRVFRTRVDPYVPVNVGVSLPALIDELAAEVTVHAAEKYAKKIDSARKSAVKALAEWQSAPVDYSGTLKALEKVVKSLESAAAKGYPDAAALEEQAGHIALNVATEVLNLAITAAKDFARIQTAQEQLDSGNVGLVGEDYVSATDFYEKSGKNSTRGL